MGWQQPVDRDALTFARAGQRDATPPRFGCRFLGIDFLFGRSSGAEESQPSSGGVLPPEQGAPVGRPTQSVWVSVSLNFARRCQRQTEVIPSIPLFRQLPLITKPPNPTATSTRTPAVSGDPVPELPSRTRAHCQATPFPTQPESAVGWPAQPPASPSLRRPTTCVSPLAGGSN